MPLKMLLIDYFLEKKVLRFKNGEKVEKCATPWFNKIKITLKINNMDRKKKSESDYTINSL